MRLFSLSVLLSVSVSFLAFNQEIPSCKEMIYRAYVDGKPELWKKEIIKLNDIYIATPSAGNLEKVVMAQYGYIPFCLKEGDKKEVSAELKEARKNLAILRESDPGNPGFIALEAAFYGFEMGINPLNGIFLAGEAKKLTNKAYDNDPDCLICISVKANQLNFTPAIFGGSTEESIPYYKKIIGIYESGRVEILNDWNFINTLVIMAGAYEKMGLYNEACSIYEKILNVEPGIRWVRNTLYPDCIKSRDRAKH